MHKYLKMKGFVKIGKLFVLKDVGYRGRGKKKKFLQRWIWLSLCLGLTEKEMKARRPILICSVLETSEDIGSDDFILNWRWLKRLQTSTAAWISQLLSLKSFWWCPDPSRKQTTLPPPHHLPQNVFVVFERLWTHRERKKGLISIQFTYVFLAIPSLPWYLITFKQLLGGEET